MALTISVSRGRRSRYASGRRRAVVELEGQCIEPPGRAWSSANGCARTQSDSAHSMRARRAGGSSSRGALRTTNFDITPKSNTSACAPPIAAPPALLAAARCRARERRAPDVGQLAHERRRRAGGTRGAFAHLRRARLQGRSAGAGRVSAVDDVAVGSERVPACAAPWRLRIAAARELAGRGRPPFGACPCAPRPSRAARARGAARFGAGSSPSPARRDVGQQSGSTSGQRVRVGAVGRGLRPAPADSRSAAATGRGSARAARAAWRRRTAPRPSPALAGHVETPTVPEFRGHVHCGSCLVVVAEAAAHRRRGCAAALPARS